MNIVNFGTITNHCLVSIENPVPFTIMVNSPYRPTVHAVICRTHNYSQENIITTIEMLYYKKISNYWYFIADIKNILGTMFENFDDTLQSADTWTNIDDFLQDFLITVVVSNGVDPADNMVIPATAILRATQFGENNQLCIPSTLSNINKDETVICGSNNLCYIYAITKSEDEVSIEPSVGEQIYTDSDDIILTNNSDDILTE